MRVLEACESAVKSLKGLSEHPWLEAQLLLSQRLGVKRTYLIGHPEAALPKGLQEGFFEDIKRRKSGEPIAYILKRKPFWTMELLVGPGVFIPRPDTECIVEAILLRVRAEKINVKRVLDLCTGSGAILLALLSEFPGAFGVGVDLSNDALFFFQTNAKRTGMALRTAFLRADIQDPWPLKEGLFDMIVSNPPYIPSKELASLPPEVVEFEPRLALDGGDTGMRFYPSLIGQAGSFLTLGGFLALECALDQADTLEGVAKLHGFGDFQLIQDYAGRKRGLLMRLMQRRRF
jgi:release factor glutamine methyltransferase